MIGIMMQVRTKPGKADAFIALIAQLQADVLANEPGVRLYSVMRAEADPDLFIFTQLFATAEAHAVHPDMPYHAAMSAAGWACVEGQPTILRLAPISRCTGIQENPA
jgi:quinol monooxygenase YgiN